MSFLSRRSVLIGVPLAAMGIVLGAELWTHFGPGTELRPLDNADSFELFSLDPSMRGWPATPGQRIFNGYRVLGSTIVTDSQTRSDISAALKAGIRASDGNEAACFEPRHGIRVTQANTVTDYIICFECKVVEVWRDEKRITSLPTTRSPQPVLDRVLQTAGVPLAPRPD
jgi:hypothetical protein